MTDVLIASPYTRPFYGSYIDSLWRTEPPGDSGTIGWKRWPFTPIDEARNFICAQVVKHSTYSHILFIDSDATWHPGALRRLVSRDKPVICGTFFTRVLPPTPTIGVYSGRTKEHKDIYRFGPTVQRIREHAARHGLEPGCANELVLPRTKYDLWNPDGFGMHFTLIRRDVLEAMTPPWFLMGGETGAGEDFYFCKKAVEAGFSLWNDLSVFVGHSIGEDAEFGISELLAFTTYVNQAFGFDHDNRWQVEPA